MSAGAIRAGQAYVELATRDKLLVSGLARAGARLRAFGAAVTSMGMALAAIGLALATPLLMAVKLAADATETVSKFEAVFGEQADAARAAMESFVGAVGRSRVEAMNGLAAFQAMFTGLGFGGAQARQMSEQMHALAVDFGSFHNISDPEAVQRFISALAGSTQVLDMFGISIREASMNQALLQLGIRGTVQTATEAQKVQARLLIIQQSMNRQNATGDAIRTADSLSNRWKRLRGVFLDTAVAVGNALIPTISRIVAVLTTVVRGVGEWMGRNQALVLIIAGAVAGLTALGVALLILGPAISAVGFALSMLAFAFKVVIAVVVILKGILLGLLTPFGMVMLALDLLRGYIVTTTASSSGALETLGQGFRALGGIAVTTWQGIADAIAAGDLQGAMEMAWLGVRIAWSTGIAFLSIAWRQFRDFFLDTWDAASTTLAIGLNATWTALQYGFQFVVSALATGWDVFVLGLRIAFEEFVGWFRRAWARVRHIFNPEEAQRQVDAINEEIRASLDGAAEEVDERARERTRNLDRIRDEGRERDRQIRAQQQEAVDGRRREREAANAGDRAAIAQLQGELQARRDELMWSRALTEGVAAAQAARVNTPTAADVARDAAKVDVKGTFSAFALRGLQFADSVGERTARATERTVDELRGLRGDVRDSGGLAVV